MDVDDFLHSITPEQMDRLEAQYLVRWQREEWVARQHSTKQLQAQGCEVIATDGKAKADVWFWNDED